MKVRYAFIMLALALVLLFAPQVQAQQAESFVADVTVSDEAVQFAIDGKYVSFFMRVAGPNDFFFERQFGSDETPMLSLVSQQEAMADGPYQFEVTARPFLPEAARAELDKAHTEEDRAALARQLKAAGVNSHAMVYSLTVGVAEGKFIDPKEDEVDAGVPAQDLGVNKSSGVTPGSIRLTGRRLQPDYQFAGRANVAAPDATGGTLQTATAQPSADDLPPFAQADANPANMWYEATFENKDADGTTVQFEGYVRPVALDGQGQVVQAYFREIRADGTTPEVWQPGFFRADDAGFSFLSLADVVEQATATPLFDYLTDEEPLTEEEAAMRDQVILDDLIVDGSICVGFDCVSGESFGFDTLRLKENNLRIRAFDTSNSASFPTRDWQITFNDTSNGGADKFSIDDLDGGRTPFTIEANAPSHSLYVDDGGRIGFGTSTPVVQLHSKDGNTPALRLEQDGSSGFQAQTWDVASNETNFFIRDATNGSKLPFRIRPSAPTNSIYINTDGNIGMGTASPEQPLHIVQNGAVQLRLENTSANGEIWNLNSSTNGPFRISEVDAVTAVTELELTAEGHMTLAGTLTACNDTTLPECVGGAMTFPDYVFEQDYDLISLAELKAYVEQNKHLPEIPTAADVNENGINMTLLQVKLLKKIEELTLYTIEQQETIEDMRQTQATQHALIEALEARLQALTQTPDQ